MRVPVFAVLAAVLLLAPSAPAGEEDALGEVLERLKSIEGRLQKIERMLATWSPPPEIGPLQLAHRTPASVSVVLDPKSLRIEYGQSFHGHPGRCLVTLTIEARVKLLHASGPVRGLMLSIHEKPRRSFTDRRPWKAIWSRTGEETWAASEERTLTFTSSMMSDDLVSILERDLSRKVIADLASEGLYLYVDYAHFTDDTAWWDVCRYWVARIAELEQGMSFKAVRESLPGYDDDVGEQAFPGKPVLRSWLLSPRWLVQVTFDGEGLTGKPVLIPVGPHVDPRNHGRGN